MKRTSIGSDRVSFPVTVRSEFEGLLKSFVDLPTVSADPLHHKDIRRCAELAIETIRSFGGVAELIETEGNPIVHGVFNAGKNLPCVTLYNHLDVQPASQKTEPWAHDPFVMKIDGDQYLGRGTTDDKGPAISALFGIRAVREADIPLNLQVLWEFEEETGSANFASGIRSAGSKVATDSVVVSDTIWISRDRPACPAGLRGLQCSSSRCRPGKPTSIPE